MIAVLTDPTIGGTFLTWSLHYLAGHNTYYYAKQNRWVDIVDNPLTGKNSHGFRSNHANTLESFNQLYPKLLTTPGKNFHTIYLHNFKSTIISKDINMQTAADRLAEDQLVLLTLSPEHCLYQWSYKMRPDSIPSWKDPTKKLSDSHAALEDFTDYFFKESTKIWQELNLTDIWDRREFLALNLRPFDVISILPNIDLSRDHYRLESIELWNTFDQTVADLFSYLGLTVDPVRRESWQPIYNTWRKYHYQRMMFVWYFDKIIDYIINGYSLDLTRFNLDLIQEATIQHKLLYNHNLNLKTWQLVKFQNTKQLHQLLEPNIHSLSTTI